MGFVGSLKQILEIFNSQGSRQFFLIFVISFAGIAIELAGLMMLYEVISSLFQMRVAKPNPTRLKHAWQRAGVA